MIGRMTVLTLLLTAAVGMRPAVAAQEEGFVTLPAPPAVPRTLHAAGVGPNGLTGYVIDLGRTVKAGTAYRLERLSGGPLTDLDVWFYGDIDDPGSVCPAVRQQPDGDGGETGAFTCDARWALVVLFTGVDVTFRFRW